MQVPAFDNAEVGRRLVRVFGLEDVFIIDPTRAPEFRDLAAAIQVGGQILYIHTVDRYAWGYLECLLTQPVLGYFRWSHSVLSVRAPYCC